MTPAPEDPSPSVAVAEHPGAPSGAAARPERLVVTARSLALTLLAVAAVIAVVQVLQSATRVLGWATVAATLAGLLAPAVDRLARHVPRGLAVLAVLLALAGVLGLLVWGGYDSVNTQAKRLEKAAPRAAADLERSTRFGSTARAMDLKARVDRLVDDLPARLRGGNTAAALRSAGTRGLAFFITGIMTLFFLLHGRRLARGALDQIHEPHRRARARRTLVEAHRRWSSYLSWMLLQAVVVGALMTLLATLLDLPGALLLGIWTAVWSLAPTVGIVTGSLPAVILAAAFRPAEGLLVLGLALLTQVVEIVWAQPVIEARSQHVGPAVTVLAGMVGLEAYGAGGMLGGVAAAAFVVAVVGALGAAGQGDPAAGTADLLADDALDDVGA